MEEIEVHIDIARNEEQFAHLVEEAAALYGLQIHLKTFLSSYPGSQHWHLRKPGQPGTLEITLWLAGKRVWSPCIPTGATSGLQMSCPASNSGWRSRRIDQV